MLFNSLFFIFIFFPIVTTIYYLLPHKSRWAWLLFASCYFYMGFIPAYIAILAFTITIDYFAGLYIEKLQGKNKRYFLILSIISNIGILFVFKYFNFFNTNIAKLAEVLHLHYPIESLALILPIGLSFHTFQSLSYIIEVYRGNQKAERSFGIFALYVMFYPQLVAGPIERPQNLLHQFHEKHYLKFEQFFSGLGLVIWGLFKKTVISDRIAIFVDQIFNNSGNYFGGHFALATFLFAFQIYCDFSGYSDMARGLARTLGFELMVNFRAPYFSRSISEFWSRWHISLSTWFKDYFYISLGGNRVAKWRWQLNLFLTFLLSGIWHGASWAFVIWGSLNGFYLVFSLLTATWRKQLVSTLGLQKVTWLYTALQQLITFALICVAWVFFRAKTFTEARYVLTRIFTMNWNLKAVFEYYHQYFNSLTIGFVGIACLLVADYLITNEKYRARLTSFAMPFKFTFFAVLVFLIMLLGQFNNDQFIYFQF